MTDLSVPLGENRINRELIFFASYEEMACRPHFKPAIDPQSVELVEVVGCYHLADRLACGLDECHRGHKKGILFKGRLVSSGRFVEGIMGHLCGKKYFGVAFTDLLKQAKTAHRIFSYSRQFLTARQGFPLLLTCIEEIKAREHGPRWLQTQLSKLRDALPANIYGNLRQRASAGGGDVFEARQLSAERSEIREVMLGKADTAKDNKPTIEHVKIGTFRGLEVFTLPIQDLFIGGCEERIKQLNAVDPESLSENGLRKTAMEADEIPRTLNRCEELLQAAQLFFTLPNYDLLLHLAKTRREKQAVARTRTLFKCELYPHTLTQHDA